MQLSDNMQARRLVEAVMGLDEIDRPVYCLQLSRDHSLDPLPHCARQRLLLSRCQRGDLCLHDNARGQRASGWRTTAGTADEKTAFNNRHTVIVKSLNT